MTSQGVPTLEGERKDLHLQEAVAATAAWWREEDRQGTLLDNETLWREIHLRYRSLHADAADGDERQRWADLASRLVSLTSKAPRNEREAMEEAAALLAVTADRPLAERARALHAVADDHDLEPSKVLGLLGPGVGYPWMFPRSLWNTQLLVESLEAVLATFEWRPGRAPEAAWLVEHLAGSTIPDLLCELRTRAPDGSDLERMLTATVGLSRSMQEDDRDISVVEARAFVDALAGHGLGQDVDRLSGPLSRLREAVVLLASYRLYQQAERSLAAAHQMRHDDDAGALASTRRAANVYQRLAVAQKYPERLLERHQSISRQMEEIRPEVSEPDQRPDHVLLVSTFNSPSDLQRLLLSVAHELMAFAYGKRVHVIVSDDSTPELRERNRRMIEDLVRAGMSISHWSLDRKEAYLDQLNAEVFPDGSFDVRDLAGLRKRGEKGIPYGRFRNFLRLIALKEVRELGLEDPILTWLDQDNEIGALVLTKAGKLAKRHVFNYFDQKSRLFEDDDLLVAGGGYTNDALEGVEKFWVAWGILHHALDLAQRNDPDGPPILPAEPDITEFRPWDQPDTLERLPREGERVTTLSDQVVLLLTTLVGTFRGKYDNQVQVYHPWTFGYVDPDEELLVEERRPFAGMPGGNTSFSTEVLTSSTPFITVGGRGEDIFHLWQLEASHGEGSIYLTHTPALHTRNVRSGRTDLMEEIVDSYNGRILREPPLLWGALSAALAGRDFREQEAQLLDETEETINNLRSEARSRIAEVSGFAAAMEPYIEENSDFWWVRMAHEDERYHQLLTELREIVGRFKDAGRYHAQAEERLMGLDDVRELTEQFMTSYPHWQTVVAHVGGEVSTRGAAEAAAVTPSAGYDAVAPARAEPERAGASRAGPELRVSGDAMPDPPWHEVVSASLSLYRRFEMGRAQSDQFIRWPQRLERLRDIFRHYVGLVGPVPDFVWAQIYRDALLTPSSPPYAAVTAILAGPFWDLDREGREAELRRVAAEFGADEVLLRQAVDVPVETHVPS